MRIRVSVLVASMVLAVGLAACGGSDTSTTRPTSTPAMGFDAADLAAIVLLEVDAPRGTVYEPDGSGPAAIDDIAEDEDEEKFLTEVGFKAAHLGTFATEGFLDVEDPSGAPAGSRFVASVAIAVRDEAGATRALDRFEADFKADAQGIATITAPGLGDGGVAYSFTALDAETHFPGFTIMWRRGNGVFLIIVAGVPGAATEAETKALAKTIDDRAKGRA